ncbi:MAG: iron ABC transporter permease [Anaerovoracaceae bacterium]
MASYDERDLIYRRKHRRWHMTNLILILVLIALMIACLCIGKYTVSPLDSIKILLNRQGDWSPMAEKIVLGVRFPRVFATIVVGCGLALSGAVYQGVFKNPLVSPEFLGVSSGACIGAAVGILAAAGAAAIQGLAFLGGIVAVLLTLMIPRLLRSTSNIMLVLSGIIVSGAMSSILGFIKYIADPETELAAITYWQMGSFAYIDLKSLFTVLPLAIIALVVLLAMAWWIDILSLGEKEAQMLGAKVSGLRLVCIICATILTSSAVCIAGTIGWIGLVIPHFGRMMVGANNRRLLPAACLLGGIFLLLVDTLTRMIGPAEMPISILTGIVGAPFYAWLLYQQRMELR